MTSCKTLSDSRTGPWLQSIERRVRYLESALAGFQEITGVCTGGGSQIIVDIVANVRNMDGTFTLEFSSEPGTFYQVQQSVNGGVTWTIAGDWIEAADSPAISTEWTSAVFAIDASVWFRVRRYPAVHTPCRPPVPGGSCPDIIVS